MTDKPRRRVLANVHEIADPAVDVKRHECFERWIKTARDSAESAPDPLKRLLGGVDAIEVSQEEEDAIKTWASHIDGWQDAPETQKPLLFQGVGHGGGWG